MKRMAVLAFSMIAALSSGAARAQEVLKMSNWLPPTHPITTQIIKPWIESVSEKSGGRLVIRQLPMALGAPQAHFTLARDGVADVVIGVPGYTPGLFVSDKLYTLPFIGTTATSVSLAAWRTHQKYFAPLNEYKGVRLLGLFSHGPGQVHTKKEIRSLSDLQGLKVRVTGGYLNEIASSLKMVPLLKPATESYELLSSGVADGTLLPMESMVAFHLPKVTTHTLLVPGGFYFATFFIGVNEGKYQSLSAEAKAALDAASGEALVRLAGGVFDAGDAKALKELEASGHKLSVANDQLRGEIKAMTSHVEKLWLDEIKAKGMDGSEALRYFREQNAANGRPL